MTPRHISADRAYELWELSRMDTVRLLQAKNQELHQLYALIGIQDEQHRCFFGSEPPPLEFELHLKKAVAS